MGIHIGRLLDEGCTNILARAYHSYSRRNTMRTVIIVGEDSRGFIDSQGYVWEAASAINMYGFPLSEEEFNATKKLLNKE